MVFFLFFFIHCNTAFTSGGKAKWKINQQHANFYFTFLRIVRQIAFVVQVRFHIVLLSHEYSIQYVYLLPEENYSGFSCAEFFSTEADKYFLPFEEPPIRGATVYQQQQTCAKVTFLNKFINKNSQLSQQTKSLLLYHTKTFEPTNKIS